MNSRRRRIIVLASLLVFVLLGGPAPARADSTGRDESGAVSPDTGTVSGRFIVKGEGSMAGGNVVFYSAEHGAPPKMSQYIRVPSLNTEILPDGSFRAELPTGKYYFGAIKRNSGKNYGRPSSGDYWFRYREANSVALKEFTVSKGEHVDFGVLEATPGWREENVRGRGKTAIKGTILDRHGKPVENGVVFAYSQPRMQGRTPMFVSNFTGSDGKYSLRVAGNGMYYLMAREVLGGGKLEVGEIIGVYGDDQPAGVSVKAGETLKGKDIRISRVQPRGPGEKTAVEEGEGSREAARTGYLTGKAVMENGSPLSGAFVYLFDADQQQSPDQIQAGDRFWWELNQVAGQLNRHGVFDVEVPVGAYYLTIIKRSSGEVLEPLQKGDLYYRHRASAGSNKVVTVKAGKETDLGTVVAYRYTEKGITDYPRTRAIASVYGKVTDRNGKPARGAYILVYGEPDRLGPPLFSGGPTRADGSYNMMFSEEGTYYLVAKLGEGIGRGVGLRPDIMLGRYGGEQGKPLVIHKGDVKTGVDIVLQPVGLPTN